MPTGRSIVLLLTALTVGLVPMASRAQTLAAALAEVDPNAPDPRMDDDGPEASPPSIDAPGMVSQASPQSDQVYDDHVRAAFAAAQNQKGPLEGAWQVIDAQGRVALKLELSDARDGGINGAWFDPNADAKAATGLIDDAIRQGSGFIAHLLPQGSLDLTTLQLQPSSDGAWSGTLLRGARTQPVVMKRVPASPGAFAGAAMGSVSPYNPAAARPAAKAPVKKKVVRKAPAKKPAAKPAAKAPAKAPAKK